MPPVLLAGLLYLGSGIGLMIVHTARRIRSTTTASLTRADLPWLGGAVLFGGIAAPVLLLTGLQSVYGSTASLLLNLEGVFTAFLAWFTFRENFDRRIALGMGLIVAGGVALSWPGEGGWSLPTGSLLVAAACFCWGIDNNLTQRVSACDPILITSIKGLIAGSVNLGIAFAIGSEMPTLSIVIGSATVGLLGYGISLTLFVLSLRHLGTARTGAYFSLAPFIGAAVAIPLLGESLSTSLLIAAALMGAGVWLHLTENHDHEHVHDPAEHTHQHSHDEHHSHSHDDDTDPIRPHTHWHVHHPVLHCHKHYPDIHHRHGHDDE